MQNIEVTKQTVVRPGDVPTHSFSWGTLTWVCNAQVTGSANLTVGLVTIQPGKKNPKHYHPNCEEVLYMQEGEVDHSLGDQVFHLKAGDVIRIPRNVPHDAINTGKSLVRMVVTYDSGTRETVVCEDSHEE